jgi:hypothetical protein
LPFLLPKEKHTSIARVQLKIMEVQHTQRPVEMASIVCGNTVLTHDSQIDRVAGSLSLCVGSETSIVARRVTCDTL